MSIILSDKISSSISTVIILCRSEISKSHYTSRLFKEGFLELNRDFVIRVNLCFLKLNDLPEHPWDVLARTEGRCSYNCVCYTWCVICSYYCDLVTSFWRDALGLWDAVMISRFRQSLCKAILLLHMLTKNVH